MEQKTARLTVLIDPNKKAVFELLCAQQDRTASQVVRQLIRDYLAQHSVEYQGRGAADNATDRPDADAKARSPARPAVKAGGVASAKSRPGLRRA
jgi:hypothetical protein